MTILVRNVHLCNLHPCLEGSTHSNDKSNKVGNRNVCTGWSYRTGWVGWWLDPCPKSQLTMSVRASADDNEPTRLTTHDDSRTGPPIIQHTNDWLLSNSDREGRPPFSHNVLTRTERRLQSVFDTPWPLLHETSSARNSVVPRWSRHSASMCLLAANYLIDMK